MAQPYETISSNMPSTKDPSDDYFFVYVYAYNSNMQSYCTSGSVVVDAIQRAGEDLLEYGAVDGWEIKRFKTPQFGGSGNFFGEEISEIDETGINNTFYGNYINDTGDRYNLETGYGDLTGYLGCHHLIHDKPNACTEVDGDDDKYDAPAGASANEDQNSFEGSTASWAPVCSNTSLTKAAAVQEPVHTYIEEKLASDYWGVIDTGDRLNREHTLGEVYKFDSTAIVTPMLTYHWDDNITDRGDCASYQMDPIADTNSRLITECTKRAVRDTAENY